MNKILSIFHPRIIRSYLPYVLYTRSYVSYLSIFDHTSIISFITNHPLDHPDTLLFLYLTIIILFSLTCLSSTYQNDMEKRIIHFEGELRRSKSHQTFIFRNTISSLTHHFLLSVISSKNGTFPPKVVYSTLQLAIFPFRVPTETL